MTHNKKKHAPQTSSYTQPARSLYSTSEADQLKHRTAFVYLFRSVEKSSLLACVRSVTVFHSHVKAVSNRLDHCAIRRTMRKKKHWYLCDFVLACSLRTFHWARFERTKKMGELKDLRVWKVKFLFERSGGSLANCWREMRQKVQFWFVWRNRNSLSRYRFGETLSLDFSFRLGVQVWTGFFVYLLGVIVL